MKVSVVRGGGIGGFVTRTELDSQRLSAGDSKALAEQVKRALAVSDASAPGERSPDELLYTIAVDDGDGGRTAHFSEQTLPEEVRELIAWIDSRPEREDRIEPAGGSA